jgi:DNA invertase Pin-like site-specific DNA recombinase
MNGLEKLCSMVTNRFGKTRKQKQDNGRYVVYYRVSTKRQGESGLGLEAQRAAVEAYIRQHGGEVIAEYEEIESGKNCRRPKIIEAILHCHRSWATLLIAKMDRLARNVFFISTLMESDVPFLACDNVHASRLTVHVLAAVAEEEARLISERTKAALRAFRLRGGRLGPTTFKNCEAWKPKQEEARKRATQRNTEIATVAYEEVRPLVLSLRGQGLSLQAVADELNRQDHRTRTGKTWNKTQVKRLVDRVGREPVSVSNTAVSR